MVSDTNPDPTLYMDYNATTPLAAEVEADIADSLHQHWANPSSTHPPGRSARRVLEEARSHVAAAIGAQPEHVIFTSGGTEANNMVVRGSLEFYRATGRRGTPHLIISDTEHDAVEAPVADLQRRRLCSVTRLPCRAGGRVSVSELRAALSPDTCLVSVMHANNETGVVNDIEAIGRALSESPHRQHIWLHTDSAQTVGKLSVDVGRLGVDFLTVVGHKLYGPRIAALWASALGLTRGADGSACITLLRGGGQEGGVRPGTEITPLVRGLGTACRLVQQGLERDRQHMERLRDLLERRLLETGVAESINLRDSPRLPNTCSAVLSSRRSGREVLLRCRRLLASVGSACHETPAAPAGDRDTATTVVTGAREPRTETPETSGDVGDEGVSAAPGLCGAPDGARGVGGLSGVLLRSGVSPKDARRTVRLSLGRATSEQDVLDVVEDLRQALREAGEEQEDAA
ncbi:selenocysteine lyase-like [Amphibalanus amphitrite]|uniref:selenocysteine lyase-like n=1 Tax=Amphibalanus amphitrite TaxID=1232801 RepID=UPI001C905902|nr:selenocysteine lyase-like [Amphibalanus amphitrite]